MRVYMKKEHETFVERNKERIEEWIVIWNVIYPGKTPIGARNFRKYEQIDIQTLLEPWDNSLSKKMENIKMSAIEAIRKDYKSDEDIFDELIKTPEAVIDFDRTWNGKYEYVRCGNCKEHMLGHREEKCRHKEGVYDEDIVIRYENNIRTCVQMRTILIQYINRQKKEAMDYK